MMESMPTFSDKDLQVVHRKTEKGVWKDELWTKRDFEALELQLAPVSSQLKDSNLMAAGHAVVGLPKHGRGRILTTPPWPLMVEEGPPWLRKGSIDPEEHLGSFFWPVGRTSKDKEANMQMQNVSFEGSYKVALPGPKRRKVSFVNWHSTEMPSLPILVNSKPLNKNTKLLVFLQEKKDEEPQTK